MKKPGPLSDCVEQDPGSSPPPAQNRLYHEQEINFYLEAVCYSHWPILTKVTFLFSPSREVSFYSKGTHLGFPLK